MASYGSSLASVLSLLLLATAAVTLAPAGARGAAHAGSGVLYVGCLVPLASTAGFAVLCDAVQMAFDEARNQSGLLPNHTLVVKTLSTAYGGTQHALQSYMGVMDPAKANASKTTIAMVGDIYEPSTLLLSHLASYYQSPMLSAAVTADELSEPQHSYFLRLIPSATQSVEATVATMQQFKWRRAAVIIRADAGGQSLQKAFEAQAKQNGLELAFFFVDSSAASWRLEFERLHQSSYRVVVIASTPSQARLAAAGELGMLNNKEWAFIGLTWCDIPQSTVTAEQMRGMICVRQLQSAGASFEAWKARFSQRPIQKASFFSPANTFGVAYTNIGWVIVRALQRMLYGNATAQVTASTPFVTSNFTGTMLRDAMLNISMVGADGATVDFDANGNVQRRFEIANHLENPFTSLMFAQWGTKLGEYSPSTKQLNMEADYTSRVVFGGGSKTPAQDSPMRSLRTVSSGSRALGYGVTFASLLTVAMYVFSLALFRDHSKIKSSSPRIGMISLCGAAMLSATVPMMAQTADSTSMCLAISWLTSIGLQVMLLPLVAKTWRLHRIFNTAQLMNIPKIHDAVLYKIIGAGVAVEAALMLVWQLTTHPTARLVSVRSEKYVDVWECQDYDTTLAWVLWLLPKVAVSLYGSMLAWRVRTIKHPEFNESRSLANSILVIVCFFVLIVPLRQVLHPVDPSLSFVVLSLLLGCCVVFSMSIMYLPLLSIRTRASVYVDRSHTVPQQRQRSSRTTPNGELLATDPLSRKSDSHRKRGRASLASGATAPESIAPSNGKHRAFESAIIEEAADQLHPLGCAGAPHGRSQDDDAKRAGPQSPNVRHDRVAVRSSQTVSHINVQTLSSSVLQAYPTRAYAITGPQASLSKANSSSIVSD